MVKQQHEVMVMGKIIGHCNWYMAQDMCNEMSCDYDDFISIYPNEIPSCKHLAFDPVNGTVRCLDKNFKELSVVTLLPVLAKLP